jgi:hypothetical protein
MLKPNIQPYQFPKSSIFGRIVAKDKIFEKTKTKAIIKKKFQQQIQRIRCSHELTEAHLHLKSNHNVPKILIIQLTVKVEAIDIIILETIDKAFGVPVIFELHKNNNIAYAACYRQRNEADKNKWVFSEYFFSQWTTKDTKKTVLPVALNLSSLYALLIRQLLPLSSEEALPLLVDKIEQIQKQKREIKKLEIQIKKEKQYKKQVELNRTANQLKTKIANSIEGVDATSQI